MSKINFSHLHTRLMSATVLSATLLLPHLAKADSPAPKAEAAIKKTSKEREPASSCDDCAKLNEAANKVDIKKGLGDQVDQVYDSTRVLADSVRLHKGKKISDLSAKAMMDLTLKLLKIDPSGEAMATLYPSYQEHEREFEKVISKYRQADKDIVNLAIAVRQQNGGD